MELEVYPPAVREADQMIVVKIFFWKLMELFMKMQKRTKI